MADRYWVGGTASWDATAGTKWALTSGGAGGQAVPTSADDVFFDGNSGAVTCTIASGNTGAKSITCTGFTGTLAGSTAITVSGSVTLVAGMTFTYSGTLTLNATGTLTTASKTLGAVTISGSGITVTLGDALTSSSTITVTQGTFDTANYNVTATQLTSSNSNTRTITLGSSTVTFSANSSPITFGVSTNLTFNAGTSSIICNGLGNNFDGGTGQTFYNVSWTGTATGTKGIVGANTFNNLTVTGPASAGVILFTFSARQIINGTLSTTGTAGNRRVWFQGATYGIAQTLTINSAPSLTDADFRDIYVIGTSAPISGTRVGNLRGCRGITFDSPKSVYWVTAAGGNWSANNWATSSGGAASTDNFPLAQDTAIIENTGLNTSATVTLDSAITYIGSFDVSTRTNAMTFSASVSPTFYGNLTLGSGVTYNANLGTITLSGRNTQTITSAGKTLGDITVDSYGGTVQLADALNIGSNTLTVTNGTFDTKNCNVTAGVLSSSNSNVRTIALGSSTVTLSATITHNLATSTNLTFNAGTSTVVIQGLSTTTLAGPTTGPAITFYNVSFIPTTTTASMAPTITGSLVFNNLLYTPHTSASVISAVIGGNQTINGTLTVAGATAVRRIFLRSDTLGTTRTLTVNTLSADDCDFRDITIAGTAAGSSPTRAGDCGGNSGITFPAPKTVYWNLAGTQNWSADGWATSSGGAPATNNFPLAQDTATFDNTGSAGTITIDAAWNIGAFDASARTSAMTLTTSTNAPFVYGNWLFGTGVTSSSTTGTITFAKRGTQTITSNGITFGCPITINCVTGTTNLADALALDSTRTLTLTSGTFDAVSYNVTTGLFSSTTATQVLKMGSGTWTVSGTGTVWDMGLGGGAKYNGTADIILSDTSTSARTFTGGGYSYNKLTIGGATGTSTLTITGNNSFTELASTKTVAHTIALGSTTQTFGKWSVTGTSGNVVTLTGTGTSHVLAGAATSAIDYLAMGSIGFAATSPGEFYAGANSTGTATAPVYRTAPPAATTRYWVGGTGTWDATTTTNWSTSSGGAGGASVPTSLDDVIFNTSSSTANAAYTCTIGTGATVRAKKITMGGPGAGNDITWAGSGTMIIHDDFDLTAGTADCTRTFTGLITLSGSTTGLTFNSNGVTLASAIVLNGVNAEWALASAFNTSGILTLRTGSFDFAGYNMTVGSIQSGVSDKRTINFGTGTTTITGNNAIIFSNLELFRANLTCIASTSQINLSGSTIQFQGNGQTFYNVDVTNTTSPVSVTFSATTPATGGSITTATFNNLTFTGLTSAGLKTIILNGDITVNGTLTFSAGTDATMRQFCRSNTLGTTRTITAAAFSGTDVDFRDITIAGVAAPVSGTRLGDAKGNSGITFDAGKTVYVRSTGSANWSSSSGWSATSGGAADVTQFPLAQDTAVFPAATYPSSGSTITVDQSYNIGTIDMSLRTSNTVTLATGSTTPGIYGNWINGTGTTLSGTGAMTFAGRGSQTITSAGKTFTQLITIDTPGGSVTLQDAFIASQSSASVLGITRGTFDAATYNLTLSGASAGVSSSNSNTRTIAVGSGTWSISGTTSAWAASTSTNLTVTGTGTISLTSASSKTFAGGGVSYSGITVDNGGAGTLTISGNNTFKDITNTYKATGAANITIGTTTQTVSQFTAAGESGRVLTVQGTSASSPGTLVLSTTTKPNVDYLTITGVRAYSLDTTWYAGANSTNNGSLGWLFEAAPAAAATGNFFMIFG